MGVEEVLEKVECLAGQRESGTESRERISLVELTGGEPLLQPETPALAEKLLGWGYKVLIETSGERDASVLPLEVVKIMDVKCPDSGEGDTFRLKNLEALDAKDEIKFVLRSRRDYEFARTFMADYRLTSRVHQVIFSPVAADPEGRWSELNAGELAKWILSDGLPVRLGLQFHKFIWDPATRGV